MEIREYVSRDGKAVFTHWLNKLRDRQARYRIRKRIDRLSLCLDLSLGPVCDRSKDLALFRWTQLIQWFVGRREAVVGAVQPNRAHVAVDPHGHAARLFGYRRQIGVFEFRSIVSSTGESEAIYATLVSKSQIIFVF